MGSEGTAHVEGHCLYEQLPDLRDQEAWEGEVLENLARTCRRNYLLTQIK
jgi:hypothetical protein